MGTIAENLLVLSQLKTLLAEYLTAKGIQSSNTETLTSLVGKVNSISQLDTSDGNVSASDILAPRIAYSSGNRIVGTLVVSQPTTSKILSVMETTGLLTGGGVKACPDFPTKSLPTLTLS